LSLLTSDTEVALIKELNRYQDVLKTSALHYEPHVLAYYLKDLAGEFHSYYNNSEFLVDEAELRATRLLLIRAIKQVLVNGLGILGVNAPNSM
nr:arginine--tRNA ligase [Pseudomonadota bacterium]